MHKIHLYDPKIFWPLTPTWSFDTETRRTPKLYVRAVHCDPKQAHERAPSHRSGFCFIFHFFVTFLSLKFVTRITSPGTKLLQFR